MSLPHRTARRTIERKESMKILGIDPGKGGGLTIIDTGTDRRDGTIARKMPETPADLWHLIADAQPDVAYIEQVHSSPQMGVKSAFTFGEGFGRLTGMLTAAGCRWELVRPQRWQKEMGCLTKGDKNVSKAAAQRLFPWLKITHATADSLLIAEWGVRQNKEGNE